MMNVTVEVQKAKNEIDFTVKVIKPNCAPQLFNNLPIIDCLVNTGCSVEQIAKHERVDNG
jgi:hypothetical protein